MRCRTADGVVVHVVALHQHAARLIASPGTSANLRQQLKHPLGRTEVRHAQRMVTPDHAHQS